MKKLAMSFAILSLAAFFAFPVTAYAYEERDFFEEFNSLLPEGDFSLTEENALDTVGVETILSGVLESFAGGAKRSASLFFLLVGIAIIISLLEGMAKGEGKSLSRESAVGISTVFSLLIFSKLYPVCISVKEGIEQLVVFFGGLIPMFTALLASGGNLNGAAAQSLNMNITYGVIMYIADKLLMPVCMSIFIIAPLSEFDGGGISVISKKIKGFFMWALGIGSAVISAAVAMQTVVATAKDSAYLRAAKYAAGGMIPLVGSTVSASLGNLAGGLAYIKSTVGIGAIAAILVMTLSPLASLLFIRFALSTSVSILEFTDSSGGVRLFSAFRSALDTLISVYSVCSVVCVLEIAVFVKSGVSVFD